MSLSTTSLQSIVDSLMSSGESPLVSAGGYTNATVLAMASDVMRDILAAPFNWKFNRVRLAPFYTNSWQQDYASVSLTSLGWIEAVSAIDINNTALPKPRWPVEVVRSLDPTTFAQCPPRQLCWYYNAALEQGVWPGAAQIYLSPVNAAAQPINGPTNIVDANGNILVLTVYGVTGMTAPLAAAGAAAGTVLTDGTCQWTVADPNAQGFRLSELAPQQGVVYQINVIAQGKSPTFTSLAQTLTPLPDDMAGYFRDGVHAYTYRSSQDAKMRGMFPGMRAGWLGTLGQAIRAGDRERDGAGFVPDRSVVAPGYSYRLDPSYPFPR